MFKKTEAYWQNRIKNVEIAIQGTKDALEKLQKENAPARMIEAHEAQIKSYQKTLDADRKAFQEWRKEN